MAAKNSKKSSSPRDLQKHLYSIKKDLKQLTTKISKTKSSDLSKLSEDTAKKAGDTASEIIKISSELLEKTLKVVQYSYAGAIEGGKRALREQQKAAKKKTTAKKKTNAKRNSTRKKVGTKKTSSKK